MKYQNPRETKQMALILKIIEGSISHPTASDIYLEARKTLPKISLGTIYRNIDKLVEMKKILKFVSGENKFRYDFVQEDHYHIRCLNCGEVKDLKDVDLSDIKKRVQKESHYKKISLNMEMTGICRKCSKKG